MKLGRRARTSLAPVGVVAGTASAASEITKVGKFPGDRPGGPPKEVSGQRCYDLELLPRRKDKNLLRGNIWVDANTYLLRRTEGQPTKAPSWLLRDVHIVLHYGDVGGMWLQTASEATARIRILGPCTMVSRDVKYKITELVAAGSSAQTNFLSFE
jgi:hypothetical protein